MRYQSLLRMIFVIAISWVLWPTAGETAGPWKAQVVDAESKQPLEGVVVLAWWTRHVRSFGGPSQEYYDSEEVLTDKDGRFTIAARSFFSLNPLVFFRGPFFFIFKPRYGEGMWPGYKDSEMWSEEKRKALSTYAQLFQLDGIVIEMPRLRTIEERRNYLGTYRGNFLVTPREKMPLLQKAITEERRAVGYRD